MFVNVTVINMDKWLCCFRHSWHQLCHCFISSMVLNRSFNHFGLSFSVSNDRLEEYKIAEDC